LLDFGFGKARVPPIRQGQPTTHYYSTGLHHTQTLNSGSLGEENWMSVGEKRNDGERN